MLLARSLTLAFRRPLRRERPLAEHSHHWKNGADKNRNAQQQPDAKRCCSHTDCHRPHHYHSPSPVRLLNIDEACKEQTWSDQDSESYNCNRGPFIDAQCVGNIQVERRQGKKRGKQKRHSYASKQDRSSRKISDHFAVLPEVLAELTLGETDLLPEEQEAGSLLSCQLPDSAAVSLSSLPPASEALSSGCPCAKTSDTLH